jgi:peptide/nickel transport system permease protein
VNDLTPPQEVILAIRGLRIGYPSANDAVREVVHGVDLDVRKGEIHGLVGESGSGKSQLAFSTLGILPREAVVLGGSVFFQGKDLLADPARMRAARGRRIGYVPQEPMSNLDPSFTIGAQLTYGLQGRRPHEAARAAHACRDRGPGSDHAALPARDLRWDGAARPHLRRRRGRPRAHRR